MTEPCKLKGVTEPVCAAMPTPGLEKVIVTRARDFSLSQMSKTYTRGLWKRITIFYIFLATVYAIEKLLAGFNVQPRFGMNR